MYIQPMARELKPWGRFLIRWVRVIVLLGACIIIGLCVLFMWLFMLLIDWGMTLHGIMAYLVVAMLDVVVFGSLFAGMLKLREIHNRPKKSDTAAPDAR